jgi:hypothetical protein
MCFDYCPFCGESLPNLDDDTFDVEGYPICEICNYPIPVDKKRAFIEGKEEVFILCEDCVKWCTNHKDKEMRLSHKLVKSLV